MNTVKPFSLKVESMFDQNSYLGRLFHFTKLTNIKQVFLKNQDIVRSQNLIEKYKKNPAEFNGKDKELWDAKYIIQATTNQETGKIIPLIFRMYFFVPMNIPIAFGLMCLPATRLNIMFFNFFNQTYNASINYMNSSGTSDSTKLLTISYISALVSSIGTGLLLKRVFSRSVNTNLFKEIIIRILPSCMAGFLNLFCMRFDCIINGINVRDENSNILSVSKICGRKAVLEGALSRLLLPTPLIIQFLIVRQLRKTNLRSHSLIFLELLLCGLALGIGLPLSIAIFQQNSKIHVTKVEKEFLNLFNEKNEPIEYIFYNKGL